LATAKGFVVFFRRDVIPGYSGDDCAVRERKLPLPIGLDRFIVAQNRADIVEVAFFVGHGDEPPIAVSGGHFFTKIAEPLSSACRDAVAVKATTPASIATATSKKVIRFMMVPSSNIW
jgi:hypothetical protein